MPRYKLLRYNKEGTETAQYRFHQSRAKVRLFGGGFGNGKTAAMCVHALQVAKDYPGANILGFRSTYPKLRDTLIKEFRKWCPQQWIKSFPDDPPTCTLTNGSVINFRYVRQQGKGKNEETSNLLSATYDHVFGDQIEDPEITEKDFLDLFGRLRGNTEYKGNDPTMPRDGPRTMDLACNPSRNWVWRKLVYPLKQYEQGIVSPDLLVHPITGKPIIELFEASSYENVHNTGWDYIHGLEAVYRGQMRSRFLEGRWEAFEGLVYPAFDLTRHVVGHSALVQYYNRLRMDGYAPTIIEAYDHGLRSPSCYGLWFVDQYSNMFLLDGYYAVESAPETTARNIDRLRTEYKVHQLSTSDVDPAIWSDPAVFRRQAGDKRTVGKTVADIFMECEPPLFMVRANNDIMSGITKVAAALAIHNAHQHPITGNFGAPHLYASDKCTWWVNEITDYMWKKDAQGAIEDEPVDRNDHAMDMTKYALTASIAPAKFTATRTRPKITHPRLLKWTEQDAPTSPQSHKSHRYGNG